jgi:hypothetical protein
MKPVNIMLGGVFLIVPGNSPGEGDPAVFDLHFDGVARNRRVPGKAFDRGGGNLLVAGVLYPAFGILLSPIIDALAMSLSSASVIANALRLRGLKL